MVQKKPIYKAFRHLFIDNDDYNHVNDDDDDDNNNNNNNNNINNNNNNNIWFH